MLDFTSALYLGLQHASDELGPWSALTTGRPAALGEHRLAVQAAAALAGLQGCEDGCVLPSTLHLYRDLFALLAEEPVAILYDAGTYPVARWGIEAATAAGAVSHAFAHHDPQALARIAHRTSRAGLRPVVVTDGCCPGCGRVAPLREYAAIAAAKGGRLVIDDTQALGILGAGAAPGRPCGRGGGGTLPYCGLAGSHILVGSSLAKGFGAPLAALCGSTGWLTRFRTHSASRVHSSPPSAADLAAAARGLALNRMCGEGLRARLLARVQRLRNWIARSAATLLPQLPLPVQAIALARGIPAAAVHRALLDDGIRTVVTRACDGLARLSFIVTAAHRISDIDLAGRCLCRAIERLGGRMTRTVEAT